MKSLALVLLVLVVFVGLADSRMRRHRRRSDKCPEGFLNTDFAAAFTKLEPESGLDEADEENSPVNKLKTQFSNLLDEKKKFEKFLATTDDRATIKTEASELSEKIGKFNDQVEGFGGWPDKETEQLVADCIEKTIAELRKV
eukprot:gnl/Spiro4/24525_TR12159_c0_g1_i1.p1 gnl/Spiro4/24525_TR12159_c0_g1~~gnl/Spiro4/24525_TR12159_c0_g1_i1.p1  ORF type:complete len:142 (+),score=39.93 gnl/Spiro4/24525_TR12159_c0_g1_i1:39-464(+)